MVGSAELILDNCFKLVPSDHLVGEIKHSFDVFNHVAFVFLGFQEVSDCALTVHLLLLCLIALLLRLVLALG